MTNYQIMEEMVERKKFVSITCDVCKKTYKTDEVMEIQEFVRINHRCGYGSVFGDDDEIELDICQHCLKEKFGQCVRTLNPEDGECKAERSENN